MSESFERFRRLDQGVARLEGAIAVVVLLSMVLVASAQALFFNIAEHGIGWARGALDGLSWADTFLQKGTLWLAFLGASLATHQDKHIAIDVLPRLASPRLSTMLRSFASLGAGLIAFALAWVFYQACLVADAAVPFDYELLTAQGPTHVCDAGTSDLSSDLGNLDRPDLLCALRAGLALVRVPVASGGGIAQLIVPLMFALIGVRLLARALSLGSTLIRNAPSSPGGDAGDAGDAGDSGAERIAKSSDG